MDIIRVIIRVIIKGIMDKAMIKKTGRYSLWLEPDAKIKNQLQEIICKLAKQHRLPFFEPHITLLGGIETKEEKAISNAEKIAAAFDKFPLVLGEVSFSTTYFQSVFVRVKASAKLMEANIMAKKLFGMENNVFMPHISLLYRDHKMELREKIASRIKLQKLDFLAEKIIVIPESINPADWVHLAEDSFANE